LRPSSTRADRPLPRVLTGLACALAALLPAAVVAPAGAAAADDGGFAAAMLREVNRVRAVYHLAPVREDSRMDRGAAGHSRDMARRGYFAHGPWPGRVMAAAGRARSVGEVIGWRVQSSPRSEASAMVHEWLGSPAHRHVLLHDGFGRVGIGRATSSTGEGRPTALYTVDFASAS
jgi:uncharacterized protein YkwD